MDKSTIIKTLREMAKHPTVTLPRDCEALKAAADLIEQTQKQEPVAWGDIDEKGFVYGLRYWSEPDNRHEVALYTYPLQQKQEPVAYDAFKDWMMREMPPMTTIGNPEWWAKRIYERFINASPPQRQPFNHHEFGYWWFEYGSGLHPLEGEDQEQHAYRVATEAWKAAHGIKE